MKTLQQIILASLVITLALLSPAAAQTTTDSNSYFMDQDILVYNPKDLRTPVCTADGGFTSSLDPGLTNAATKPSLPNSTLQQLEKGGWRQKAEKNKEAYLEGERASGIPWTVIAAVHYREASMSPSQSIANGQPITGAGYRSIDGQKIGRTLKEDAAIAAQAFKDKAKLVYGVSLSAQSSTEDWAKAFLAYNRGFMYRNWNETFDRSPYVMNGFDDKHLNMQWIQADSFVKPGGKRLNNLAGKTEGRPGALAMMTFLGGPVNSIRCTSGSQSTNEIVSEAKRLAWPQPVQRQSSPWAPKSPPAFVDALRKHNARAEKSLGDAAFADCAAFVGTVMHSSGIDQEFPSHQTTVQNKYLRSSGKYRVKEKPARSDLSPGDIIIVNNQKDHHIIIYTGEVGKDASGKPLVMVDASMRSRTPSYRGEGDLMWILGRPGVFAATYIGQGVSQ